MGKLPNEDVRKRAPRKLVCLETYWSDRHAQAFRDRSVRPFFEGLAAQLEPPLAVAHRFLDSPAQLAAYTRHREGLLWRDPETFDTPVYYLSFHGSPGKIHTALARIGPAALCRAFTGWGKSYDNLVYFGACSVFRGAGGERFARAGQTADTEAPPVGPSLGQMLYAHFDGDFHLNPVLSLSFPQFERGCGSFAAARSTSGSAGSAAA